MNTYSDFLRGKRVVLVGPAPSVYQSKQGARIESYDVVVRLNHILPVPQELEADIGSRTDVLYHNLWHENPHCMPFEKLVPLLQKTVRWVCAAHPEVNLDHPFADDIAVFRAALRDRVPFHIVDPVAYLETTKKVGCRLNVGISALADLLRYPIQELYVTGFTFYSKAFEQYHPGYKARGFDPLHRQDLQSAFVRELRREEPRLRCDAVLEELLTEYREAV